MKTIQGILITTLMIFGTLSLLSVYATPSVEIVMEKTTYNYCEKLFYTIKVSEITGDHAILHITDQAGKTSSAIPIPISNLETPIPSAMPFEAEIFPPGRYFLDVEYSGGEDTALFDLLDSKNVCISTVMKQFAFSWLNNQVSDGFFIDAINKFVDKEIIKIPYNMSEKNLQDIHIPIWVKNIVAWWLDEKISDGETAKAIQYLINKEIIVI
ncbi:hypothetical protein YTPLAS73_08780 [Nitrosarchaeum sp.]|nr:hypothetical protein YTPLAS73_08780 [Nitrosarchaeum sp.]